MCVRTFGKYRNEAPRRPWRSGHTKRQGIDCGDMRLSPWVAEMTAKAIVRCILSISDIGYVI